MNSIASNQFTMAQGFLETSLGASKQLASNELNSEDDLKKVAQEFESLFMNMMLKSMRSANRAFSEGNYFDSFESKMYEDMMDEKLSGHLSVSGSLGIADMLVQQLRGGRPEPSYKLSIGDVSRKEAFTSPENFVTTLLPEVKNAAREMGINPRHIVAQAALETGWGSRLMFGANGKNSHNLFGIKAKSDWSGDTVSIESIEVVDGVAVKERSQFKAYDNYEDAINDYTQMLTSQSRYAKVRGSGDDVNAFGQALVAGGYATDPEYANKLARVLDNSALDATTSSLANIHLAEGAE